MKTLTSEQIEQLIESGDILIRGYKMFISNNAKELMKAEQEAEYSKTYKAQDKDFLKNIITTEIDCRYGKVSNIPKPDCVEDLYAWNNLKSGLLKPSAMTTATFCQWCKVLKLDVDIVVKEK